MTSLPAATIDEPATIKSALAIKKRRGLSLSEVSAQTGIAQSTLSQVLGNKYSGDTQKFVVKLSDWVKSSERQLEIRAKIGGKLDFVETSVSRQIMSIVELCRTEADIAAVIGAPGLGKTETAQHIAERNFRAIYMVATPSKGTPAAILRELAHKAPFPIAKQTSQIRDQLVDFLKTEISLIIIDEAQHLSFQQLEEIRLLHDESQCGVVLMGNKNILSTLGESRAATYAQLTSRVGVRFQLPAKPDPADVGLLLDALGVDDRECREHLQEVAQGHGALRRMVKTLKMARMNMDPDRDDELIDKLRWATRFRGTTAGRS